LEVASVEAISGPSSLGPQAVAAPVPTARPAVAAASRADSAASASIPDGEGENPEALKEVLGAWGRILEKTKEYNHSLLASLKLAIPAAVEGNKLMLVIPYKFHKDAVEARKNKLVIDQVIEEVTGRKLMILPMLAKDWNKPLPQMFEQAEAAQDSPPQEISIEPQAEDPRDAGLVEQALKIMGGEVEGK
jgi:hypothetical protein